MNFSNPLPSTTTVFSIAYFDNTGSSYELITYFWGAIIRNFWNFHSPFYYQSLFYLGPKSTDHYMDIFGIFICLNVLEIVNGRWMYFAMQVSWKPWLLLIESSKILNPCINKSIIMCTGNNCSYVFPYNF